MGLAAMHWSPALLHFKKMKDLVQTCCVSMSNHQLVCRHNPHSDEVPQGSTHLFSQLSHIFPIDDLSSMWGRDRRLYNLWYSRLVGAEWMEFYLWSQQE